MLKNLKITHGIAAVLVVFVTLLTLTGFLFYNGVSKADKNFVAAEQLTLQQQHLSDAVKTLIKTRVTINRVAIRFLKNQQDPKSLAAMAALLEQAGKSAAAADADFKAWQALPRKEGQGEAQATQVQTAYQQMRDTMLASITFLKQGNYAGYGNLEAQAAQDQLDSAYEAWRAVNIQLMKASSEHNQRSLTDALWALLTIGLITGVIGVAVWIGLQKLLIGPLGRLTGHMRAISGGDLTSDIQHEGRNEMGLLIQELQQMRDALVVTITSVDDATRSIFTGAAEISAGSTDLSSRTEQQAAALEQTAASMEQLTSTVKLNADNAQQATTVAKEASATAMQGGETVARVIANMDQISESSNQIAGIIAIIDSIAFQTNILALNAAVEAARAGEQGRGFAVVAGEVRSLAGRSASAAQEIRGLIDRSAERIKTGAGHASQAGVAMESIVTSVSRVTQLIEEIAASSTEQTRGIEQVCKAVSEMDGVTQQNAALVEESATAAASLEEQASYLRKTVSVFKTGTLQVAFSAAPVAKALAVPKLQPARLADNDNWQTF
ncbi:MULTISPECIES: methyl-accepting chemotaxis protein [Pantoea]|jgi:methyl-accepting chemotaxis protein|uniref:Tar ligand binding domain-containing protein n=1 Tax=Enterobacter agglomerans TaxID=549 RepID=A0ACC5PUF7_ENTAG|nr:MULTISPECIES: methyl-accepting chemotaxis protein [Pantoea]KAF6678631.1 Tar ligand binding domain-containing protein [Pantoea sp. EKM21T]KAF6685437.1 Tar ligand binding domain-containing protein [Pantoea sp. EKM22T]KOA69611.1 chemotaxis protein [Pantoea sp. CFSAN033090]KPA07847.1 Methyl-accepting chemotaxis citrate transducer [Pantoea agglomerans]MBD8116402.1 Tar ligand binding domain-containing protein [Pantoea agglomerans]